MSMKLQEFNLIVAVHEPTTSQSQANVFLFGTKENIYIPLNDNKKNIFQTFNCIL